MVMSAIPIFGATDDSHQPALVSRGVRGTTHIAKQNINFLWRLIMSIDFRIAKTLSINELLGGRLLRHRIASVIRLKKSRSDGYLADRKGNQVCVNPVKNDQDPIFFTAYGLLNPYLILKAIHEEFATRIYLESEPQFCGYSSV